jgi:hypothetical protein
MPVSDSHRLRGVDHHHLLRVFLLLDWRIQSWRILLCHVDIHVGHLRDYDSLVVDVLVLIRVLILVLLLHLLLLRHPKLQSLLLKLVDASVLVSEFVTDSLLLVGPDLHIQVLNLNASTFLFLPT